MSGDKISNQNWGTSSLCQDNSGSDPIIINTHQLVGGLSAELPMLHYLPSPILLATLMYFMSFHSK